MDLIIVPKHAGYSGNHEVKDVDGLMYQIFGRNVDKITARRDLVDTGCFFIKEILEDFTKRNVISYYMSVMGKGNNSYGILYATNMRDISCETNLVRFLLVGDLNFVDLQSEGLRDTFSRITGNELIELEREFLELFESNGNGPYYIYIKSKNKIELEKEVGKEISRMRRMIEEVRK